jgi:RNA polymerase sigma-70 factor, ECF subfamily
VYDRTRNGYQPKSQTKRGVPLPRCPQRRAGSDLEVIDIIRLSGQDAAALAPNGACSSTDSRELDHVFEGLVDSYYRRIYSLVYRMVQSEQDACDLTQETFVRVYRALPKLRAEGAQSAWIRRIATNLCLDWLRRRNSSPSVSSLDARPTEDSDFHQSWEVADPSGEPDLLFSSKERAGALYAAIAKLPEDYRTVVILHYVEDMRVEEIAEALKVPGGTIKSRLSRARRELKRKLVPYFEPELVR